MDEPTVVTRPDEPRDPPAGLTSAAVADRLRRFGRNELPPARRTPLPVRFAAQFVEPMSLLLVAAAAVSGPWLGETVEAAAIVAIVVLNAVIATIQEGRAQRALDALRTLETPTARVRRDGSIREVAAPELVPGDVVLLEAGDRVPADLELLRGSGLEVDESVLTGESLPVRKQPGVGVWEDRPVADRAGEAFTGTLVTRGLAEGEVRATGSRTQLGRIADRLRERQPPTPLQRELGHLTNRLGLVAIVLSAGVFGLTLVRVGASVSGLQRSFLTAVALAVAAVPEGLAAVTTIGLALGVRRMARQGAIVRRLPAVEALGSTTVIATDKTGTVTRNRMEVACVALARVGVRDLAELAPEVRDRLERAAVLASTATLEPPVGDPLEIALLEAVGAGRLRHLRGQETLVATVPFDSDRRRATVLTSTAAGHRVHVKGAPEVVVDRCTTALAADGSVAPLDEAARADVLGTADRLATEGMRLLALATRHGVDASALEDERNLTLLGLVALRDAVRASAPQVVRDIRSAGIRLLMVTGDHPGTARAVAEEVGMADRGSPVLTGAELRRDGVPADPTSVTIYARVDPDQKLELVEALQAGGHSVAVTGDGVNDAPALRRADIGVALGRTGSDVAREAADLVITDDDLGTIARAVREGRGIYDGIRKVVDYLVGGNLSEIAVVVSVLLLFPDIGIPLLPLQLLWINLLTDGLPALALGIDPPDHRLMERPPRDPDQRLLSSTRIGLLAARGVVIASGAVAAMAVDRFVLRDGWGTARTLLFTTLVVAHLLYAFVARQPDPLAFGARRVRWTDLGTNPLLVAALAVGLGLQVLVVVWAPARTVFDTTPLDAAGWTVALLAAVVAVALLPVVDRRAGARGG